MMTQCFCPRCTQEIPQEGRSTGFAICVCGWYDDGVAQKAQKKAEEKTFVILVAFVSLLAVLAI